MGMPGEKYLMDDVNYRTKAGSTFRLSRGWGSQTALYPERPKITKEIIEAAANILAKRHGWSHKEAIDVAVFYGHPESGYQLAKKLDTNCGWDITARTVVALDEMADMVHGIHIKSCWDWARAYNIQPEFKGGDRIRQGVIDGVSKVMPATYLVILNGQAEEDALRVFIPFEEAKTVP